MINYLVLHRFCRAKYIMSIATQIYQSGLINHYPNLEYIRQEIFKDTNPKQNLKVITNRLMIMQVLLNQTLAYTVYIFFILAENYLLKGSRDG
jgi:hypothetical protein